MTKKRITAFLCFVTLLCVFVTPLSPVSADTRTLIIINETEPNNTYVGANQTYDDYDNFGALTTSSDVDWWTVTFSSEGIANFWLGKIPSGCNYELQVYKSNGTSVIVESLKASNSQELCKVHVRSGETYYIKIYSASGSSSSHYKMRVKNYALREADAFTTTIDIDTREGGTCFLNHVWNMGFGGQEYLNNTAADFYGKLPLADIILEDNHGNSGLATFNNSYLFGNSFPGMGSQNRALSNLSTGSLSNTKMVLYLCCCTGLTDSLLGNLVDNTISKGAFTCIGWKQSFTVGAGKVWIDVFMGYIDSGHNVGNARWLTNDYFTDHFAALYPTITEEIIDQYCGSSRLFALKLG